MNARLHRPCLSGLALALAPLFAAAQTSYPMITQMHPVAVQRGRASEATVFATQPLREASQMIVEGEGVAAEALPPAEGARPNQIGVRLSVDAAAKLGTREFRVLTPAGLSSLGQVLIVDDPVVPETAGNSTRERATELTPPCVVCGRIAAPEQISWFRLQAKAGQTLTFEIVGARIEDKIHDLQQHLDPLLTLYDETGRELATCDDVLFADPLLSHTFKADGTCFVAVRDAKYGGDPRWVYALKVSARPPVIAAMPWALAPGTQNDLRLIGPAGFIGAAKLSVPAGAAPGWSDFEIATENGAVTLPFFVAAAPRLAPPGAAEPEALDLPQTLTGWLEPRQPRRFRFAAQRTRLLRFAVHARRFGANLCSTLDAVLEVQDMGGRSLLRIDDDSPLRKDATLTFIPPRDGEYVLVLQDLHGRGGPDCCFVLEAAAAEPDFELRVDGDKANLAPGGNAVWFVQVERRHNHSRPIAIMVEGLPEGVTATAPTLGPAARQGALVLSAAADAAPAVGRVRVVGREVVDGDRPALTRVAVPLQEIYLPGGGRGRFEVNLHQVAVVEDADIRSIDVEPKRLTLKPGEEATLTVKLTRRPTAARANVTLDVRLRHLNQTFGDALPPGVVLLESRSKTLLGTDNEGVLVLRAAPGAQPVKDWPIAVTASVSVNFVVKIPYASAPIPLTIEGP